MRGVRLCFLTYPLPVMGKLDITIVVVVEKAFVKYKQVADDEDEFNWNVKRSFKSLLRLINCHLTRSTDLFLAHIQKIMHDIMIAG